MSLLSTRHCCKRCCFQWLQSFLIRSLLHCTGERAELEGWGHTLTVAHWQSMAAGFLNPTSLVPQPDLSPLCARFSAQGMRGCLKTWRWKVCNLCLWSQSVCGTPVPLPNPPRDQASSQVHQERLLSTLFSVSSSPLAAEWPPHETDTLLIQSSSRYREGHLDFTTAVRVFFPLRLPLPPRRRGQRPRAPLLPS